MRFLLCLLFSGLPVLCISQTHSRIEVSDIANFWSAYDKLSSAQTTEDSIHIIQRDYLDQASPAFRKFLRVRKFNAEEYVRRISLYPKFWASVRPLTEGIVHRTEEVQEVLTNLSKHLPGFERPDVCFAIGPMRTGGTTAKNLVLIGSEMVAADSTVDKSELKSWHRSVIGNMGDITGIVAHEAVHTQQSGFPLFEIFSLIRHKKLRLLNMSVTEGSADFITEYFLGLNINTQLQDYGKMHHCEIHSAFMSAIITSPFDYSQWLFNGQGAEGMPADLGYYIGYQISEQYYQNASNKTRALKTLLKRGKYKTVFKESGFEESGCD